MKKIFRILIVLSVILLSINFISIDTYAADTYTISANESVLDTGKNVNAKIKSLVSSSATYVTNDTTITSIEWTDVAPIEGMTTVKVSESGADVIGYLDGTVVKLYTTVDTIYLNEDSSYMFFKLQSLEFLPITESKLDTSNVTDFGSMFTLCYKLAELDLSNWQVTNKCTNLSWMFQHCEKLTSLDLSTWDVSNVTEFNYMFSYCKQLAELDLSNWQVTNKCTSLSSIFYECKNLTTLICDFNTWDVSNVTDFSQMFYWCEKLTELNLSSWQVSNKCTNLSCLFCRCKNLELTCDFTTWNVSNVTDFGSMFNDCKKVTSLDLSTWTINNATVVGMFAYCTNLSELTLPANASVTSLYFTFSDCYKLPEIDLSNWTIDIREEHGLESTFYDCYNTIIKLPNTINFNKCESFYELFYNCQKLTEMPECFKQPNLDLTNIKYFSDMFNGTSLTSVDLSNWNTSNNVKKYVYMFYNCENLTQIIGLDKLNMEGLTDSVLDSINIGHGGGKTNPIRYMFYNTKITELDISGWNILYEEPFYDTFPSTLEKIKMCNTSNISENNLKDLFSIDMVLDNNEDGIGDDNVVRRDAIKDVNTTDKQIYIKYAPTYSILTTGQNFNAKIKSLVTPSATYITNDTTITSIEWTDVAPADGVKTVKVSESGADVLSYLDGTIVKLYTNVDTVYLNQDSSYMFYYLSVLETLPITESKLDSSNVTNFGDMFYKCENLTTLDVSNWDVSNCTNFGEMFYECKNLASLDVSTWDVSNGTDFDYMFYNCNKLESLDVSNWNVSNGNYFNNMFSLCESLESLDLSDWNVSNGNYFSEMFSDCTSMIKLKLFDTSKINSEADVTDFNLPTKTKYLDENEDNIADNDTEYTTPIIDTVEGNKHIYIEKKVIVYIHSNDIYDENGYSIDDSNIYTVALPNKVITESTLNELFSLIDTYNNSNVNTQFLYDSVIGYSTLVSNNKIVDIQDSYIENIRNTKKINNSTYSVGYLSYVDGTSDLYDTDSTSIIFNETNLDDIHLYMVHKRSNINMQANIISKVNVYNTIYYGDHLVYFNPETDKFKSMITALCTYTLK